MIGFLKENFLYILIPALFIALMLLKPFRRFAGYCAKNTAALTLLIFISILCSLFGYTISVNALTVSSALLLGLPGISFALFLSLVV